jgi:large-conductance mechanosensitive channel
MCIARWWLRLHMLEDFKKFVLRGNFVDLLIGVAFGLSLLRWLATCAD